MRAVGDFSSAAQRRRRLVGAHYQRIRNADRDRSILAERRGGATFRELAKGHGLSVGRVHGIVKEAHPVTAAGGRTLPARTDPRYRFTGRPRRTRRPCSLNPRTDSEGVDISHPKDSLLDARPGDYPLTDWPEIPDDPAIPSTARRRAQFWSHWHDERERERGRCGGCGLRLPEEAIEAIDRFGCPSCGRQRLSDFSRSMMLERQRLARLGVCTALLWHPAVAAIEAKLGLFLC